MTAKVVRFIINFHYHEGTPFTTQVCYMPIARHEDESESRLPAYYRSVMLGADQLSEPLRRKLVRLTEYVKTAALTLPDVEVDGTVLRGRAPALVEYEYAAGPKIRVLCREGPGNGVVTVDIEGEALTDAARRLIDNMRPMYEQIAWSDFRARLGSEAAVSPKKKVLISYRKTLPERATFAEAIAHRLGREGFLPWFDEWEVLAGDSLPRQIGAGFKDVYAVVIVLTADYPEGRWAREELETAITKRVEQDIRVIPVLFESCDRPELLRPLRYVDCRDHDANEFEGQFGQIIDALNEIELNPYRR